MKQLRERQISYGITYMWSVKIWLTWLISKHKQTSRHRKQIMVTKILQARLQHYVNRELPDVQAGFRRGRGTRDQIANICWVIEKAREIQRNIYFCFIDHAKPFDCVDHNKLWKILQETGKPDHLNLPPEKPVFRWRSYSQQQLELDMEQQTCSKLGKKYVKAVYCHPAYLTYF